MKSAAVRSARGFTLIEVVVAIFVISLTILALGPMMAGISRGNTYGQNVSLASNRLQEKAEQLRNTPYDEIIGGSESLAAPAMTRTWEVVDEPVENALKEIDLTVSWMEGGKTRSVSLKTYIANRNPRAPDDNDND